MTDTRLTGALEWAGRGFFVFPVERNGKRPLVKDWETVATTDAAQINVWAAEFPECNWGWAPGRSGRVGFDLDRKNGKDGVAELEKLAATHGFEMPDTLTIRTPSGGFHVILRGAVQSSNGRIAPGVDVKSLGGYLVAPGSQINNVPYALAGDLETWAIPEAPAKLLELANARRHEPQPTPTNVKLDSPAAKARAIAFLKSQPPAIEGHGGDSHTFAIAAALRDLGVSEDTALHLMAENWNGRCEPPWERDDLAIKVANAYAYGQNEPGAYAVPSAAETFGPAIPNIVQSAGPVSFGDVLARTVAPVREIVPGLIERGTVTFLSAPGGSHKSRLAMQWGLCVDAGVPIFGRAVERARFFYISYEDHADEVARRAQAIASRLKLPVESEGQFWDLSGRDSPLAVVLESGECETRDFWNALHEHLTATDGHKFIAIDSTYNALRFEGAAKINEGAVMAGIGLLQRLCNETNSTLLVLWHPSQAGQERGDASGWSVAWHNAPRARLSITPVKGTEDAFELRVEKRNHGPKGKALTLHWSDGALLPRTETDTSEQEATFLRAATRVAILAAEQGVPIQMKGNLVKWQLDEIEREIGRRPTQREAKEVLASALPRGMLRYLKNTRHRSAGYYPPDEEIAAALARAAKHQTSGEAADA